ncbi:MAG: diguanylate cyclase domain-containing protein [Bryobacteraceae bacterium]
MDVSGPVADLTAFLIQEIGALLFGLVFLFLFRQSRAVYFGLWAVAWLLRLIAAVFGFALMSSGHTPWLAPYATFEFAFAIVLVSAARAGFASAVKEWRAVLRLIAILPVFVAAVYLVGLYSGLAAYQATHALVLGFAYLYNFLMLRRQEGVGARVFRFSLVVLAAAFFEHAAILLWLFSHGGASQWAQYLHHESYIDFTLHCVMAFAAMAMWNESQLGRIAALKAEVDHLRRENRQRLDLDHLTGLLNQAALASRVEAARPFDGVVMVCDLDNFKEINDRYGHLVGDEILQSIGKLLAGSVRAEDEAYRWGGDEFVILFRNQQAELALRRITEIAARLSDFRVRGYGLLPVSFSWGVADARARSLREALDEADRAMYTMKRTRAAGREV